MPVDETTKLKKKRNGYRRQAKLTLGKAENVINQGNGAKLGDITDICTNLMLYNQTLCELNSQVVDSLANSEADEDTISDEIASACELQEQISSCQNQLIMLKESILAASGDGGASTVNQSSGREGRSVARLPKLELPKFSGDPLEWTTFWDSFESSIHTNDCLSPIDKFNYLRSLLKSAAYASIAGITVTNANYDSAIQLIKERFGRKHLVISAHVEALLKVPEANNDIQKLRSVYDSCEIHIRGLDALGVTDDTYGVIMAPIILSKVPEDIRLILTRANGTSVWDLKQLRGMLKAEIEAREMSVLSTKKSSHRSHPSEMTTGSLVTTAKRNHQHCVFCDEAHSPVFCTKYTTAAQRRNKVQQDKRCFNCLRENHILNNCLSTTLCRQCGQRHHTSLCNLRPNSEEKSNANPKPSPQKPFERQSQNSRRNSNQNSGPNTSSQRTVSVASTSPTLVSTTSAVLMQTALAKVNTKDGEPCCVRLLFDTGSERSFVSSTAATKLNCDAERSETLSIAPFGSSKVGPQLYDVTTLTIDCPNGVSRPLSALIVPSITCPIYRAPLNEDIINIMHDIVLADPPKQEGERVCIDVLVGLDHYWNFVHEHVIKFPNVGLTAVSSDLGWLLSGTTATTGKANSEYNVLFVGNLAEPTDTLLQRFWESETLPFVENNKQSSDSLDHDVILTRFNECIQHTGTRYEVAFPWKFENPELPTNEVLCQNRFRSLIRRLNKENLIEEYDAVIQQQLEKGFIESVPGTESPEDAVIHYISHHPVIRRDRATTKLRIVYDASAKQSKHDPSLNECLFKGPNLMNDILKIILRYRVKKIAFMADIEKAFLQVGLRPQDRDATRFLWLKNPIEPVSKENLITYRFCRVLFGATSSPFLLAATIRYHLNATNDDIARQMLNCFYVDNLITGVDDSEEAKCFYTKSKEIMYQAGMNLREWGSNSLDLMSFINQKDKAEGTNHKVLGVYWNTINDSLYVKSVPEMIESCVVSKRTVLQTISKVFDPMGLVTPITINAKMLIQDLWKLGIDWDEPLPETIITKWRSINTQIAKLDKLKIPRLMKFSSKSELHVFADASVKAYAAVAYLSEPNSSEPPALVCCKSRVAPIAKNTLPRLELMAVVLGVQLAKFVQETIPNLSNVFVWSDSQIVLYWINNCGTKQGTFVTNRLKLIQQFKYSFRYCPTKQNPADLPSRGLDITCLQNNSLWWNGPNWLSKPNDWPSNILIPKVKEKEQEALTIATKVSIEPGPAPFGICIERYNNLGKLLRITAYCNRFVKRLKGTIARNQSISVEEYSESKKQWIAYAQSAQYAKELVLLEKSKTSQMINQLRLFKQKGLIHCEGRFKHANIHLDAQNPILLPKRNHLTDLIIMDCHLSLKHQGVRHTVSYLRQSYWLPSARQQVRSVLKRCIVCRIWEGKSYDTPMSPPLPQMRVTEKPPFSFVGCDFAGPLYVRTEGGSRKAYICLFTCAVTRALHLELATDLSTEIFLQCLRRFIARRGIPLEIISDNAKTFKLAKSTLDRLWHNVVVSEAVTSYVTSTGIKWKFNVERAPWWGGFFERMVGLVKRTLKKAIGKSRLNQNSLNTQLIEIEAILNSRPLTYVYTDLDAGNPLCPNDFLAPNRKTGFPTVDEETEDPEYKVEENPVDRLLRKLHQSQKLSNRFWDVWRHEYLSHLREYHQYKDRKQKTSTIQEVPRIGDVVLIKDEGPRGYWKLGVIDSFLSGNDGAIRAATVRCKGAKLNRPLPLLYPIELSPHSSISAKESQDAVNAPSDPIPNRFCLLPRKAAEKAKEKLKQVFEAENE